MGLNLSENSDKLDSSWILLAPSSSSCYNFTRNGSLSKKTTWLVPHVIKHKEDSSIISWRCNWGLSCESGCIYAMAKENADSAFEPHGVR
jgi:hypothetical protein